MKPFMQFASRGSSLAASAALSSSDNREVRSASSSAVAACSVGQQVGRGSVLAPSGQQAQRGQ